MKDRRNKLEVIANNLDVISKNIHRYNNHIEVLRVVEKKRELLEDEFLHILQLERLTGYSETYALYHNWYKQYKGVEEL